MRYGQAEITNEFAEITNEFAEITNEFAEITNAIAEITNALAFAERLVEKPTVGIAMIATI